MDVSSPALKIEVEAEAECFYSILQLPSALLLIADSGHRIVRQP